MNDDPSSATSDAIGKIRAAARQFASDQVRARATKLGDRVAAGAATIRDVGDELQKRRQSEATGKVTETLARATDGVAAYLHGADGETLLRDARHYGRTRPAAAAAVAALAGFAAARVLKVSASGGKRAGP